jgi:hypothetical protein
MAKQYRGPELRLVRKPSPTDTDKVRQLRKQEPAQSAPVSRRQHVHDLWVKHLVESPSFPQFLMVVSFLISFGAIRLVTYGIREGWMPVGNVQSGSGLHFHHYLFGIAIALIVGYIQIAFNPTRGRSICAVFFGLAEALILDEFALLLNLKDVYWQQQGRQSIIAVAIVGSLIALLWIMRAFIGALIRGEREDES